MPESGRDRDGNNWEVVEDGISGNYSLRVQTAGDFDDNAIATDEKIIDMAEDFKLSFNWRTTDPSNEGPTLRLIKMNGSDLSNYSWPNLIYSNHLELSYGGGAISRRGSPFKGESYFNKERFETKSYAANEIHSTTIVKHGSNATLYFDGERQIEKEVNASGKFRLVLGSSGTFGSESSITFDNITYTLLDLDPVINQSLEEIVFVGSGKEMLEAVALNRTSFVAEDYSEVKKEVNRTGLEPVGVGDVEGIESVDSVNEAFNISREKYYVDSREKAAYVAALAAKNNASLTFEKSEADRDFSNLTIEELQEKFIQEFEPNHIAVADLDSNKGDLAAYMAARKGILPVDFDQDYNYPGGTEEEIDTENWNSDNGVISMEEKVDYAFRRIGENQNTIFEGKYVSILEGPRRMYSDPVEEGLINDPQDGRYYFSDQDYGDLDSDDRLEAGVGRYPEDLETSSLVFHRSVEREKGKDALIAAEYLHSNWPVILATFGGGMWDGKNHGYMLEQQGYEVTRLVEQRSQPVNLLFDLLGAPTKMDRFVQQVDSKQEQIAVFLGESGARAVKNAAYIIRGLNYAEQVLEIYLEFDWIHWQPLDQELDVPQEISIGEFRELIRSFLPDRYGKINEENLTREMKTADIVYYQGVGNSSSWTMPNNSSGLIKDRYTGENSLDPSEVPEMGGPIVWDNSDNAGKRGAKMREKFLENGAASYLGLGSVNYKSYSSFLSSDFFRYGDRVGESAKEAVNSLRSAFLVYSPESNVKVGVREKMERSLSVYGNPEMVKDPVEKEQLNSSRSCSQDTCTIRISVDPGPRVVRRDGKKHYIFNASTYLLQEFAPITPLYTSNHRLPKGSEIVSKQVDYSYRSVKNVSVARNNLLSHGQQFYNESLNYTRFPEKAARLNVTGDRLEYVQTAMMFGNRTEILEEATVEIEYTAPRWIELERDGGKLEARIYAEDDANLGLAYRVNGSQKVRDLDVSEGTGTYGLGELTTGQYDVEAYLYGDRLLASDRESVKFPEEPEVFVFAPEIHVGEERKVRTIIRNPNDFRLERELKLETGGGVQPGLLEEVARQISVPPDSDIEVSWGVVGLSEGNASLGISDESISVEVNPATSSTEIASPERLLESLRSSGNEIEIEVSDGAMKLVWKTPDGKLVIEKSSSRSYRKLATEEFEVASWDKAGEIMNSVSTPGGSYRKRTKSGITEVSGSMDRDVARERLELLERESEKLLEFSRQRGEYAED